LKLLSLTKKEAGESDETCVNGKFVGTIGLTNDSATWPVVVSRNVRNYLAQRDEPPIVTTEVFPRNESDRTRFFNFPCKRVLPDNKRRLPMFDRLDIENRICCKLLQIFSSVCAVALHQISQLWRY